MPRRVVLALLVLAATGCGGPRNQPKPTIEEQKLLRVLTTDPFILVKELHRGSDGVLEVTTAQGSTRARYRLVRPPGGPLVIERMEDELRLDVADDGVHGTGPDPRGLR